MTEKNTIGNYKKGVTIVRSVCTPIKYGMCWQKDFHYVSTGNGLILNENLGPHTQRFTAELLIYYITLLPLPKDVQSNSSAYWYKLPWRLLRPVNHIIGIVNKAHTRLRANMETLMEQGWETTISSLHRHHTYCLFKDQTDACFCSNSTSALSFNHARTVN